MPELAHNADRFLDVRDCLIIGKRPFTADGQYGRTRANLKAMDAELTRGKECLPDAAPRTGIRLTAGSQPRYGAATRDTTADDLLAIRRGIDQLREFKTWLQSREVRTTPGYEPPPPFFS